jgi:DNA-binding transcriptional regulator YiaG
MATERVDQLLADVWQWAKKHGINQSELAALLGVLPSHVTEWKKGRSRPSGENVLAMLDLIKTKPKRKREGKR